MPNDGGRPMTDEDLAAIQVRFEKYRTLGAPDIAALLAEIKRLRILHGCPVCEREAALDRLTESETKHN